MSTMTAMHRAGAFMAPAALVLALGTTAPASAATAADQARSATGADTAASCTEGQDPSTAATSMTQLTGQQAEDAVAAVRSALASGDISIAAPSGDLALDQAKVYTVDAEGSSYTSVTVPVGGSYNSHVSNLTAVIDADGNVVQSGETLIGENADGNFNISTYADGSLVRSNDTDRSYRTAEQLQAADANSADEVTTRGAGSTAACVAAVLGVSGTTAYLIVGACAGACTIPIAGTAICVACIGAYAAVGGASITAVASCF